MRLKQVSVEGLFDLYDYTIPLNTDERVTILFAPNGYGKTTIFKLIDAAINVNISYIRKVPFSKFTLEFKKDDSFESNEKIRSFEIIKQMVLYNDENPYEFIKSKITTFGENTQEYDINLDNETINDREISIFIRQLEKENLIKKIGPGKWKDLKTGNRLGKSDLIRTYGSSFLPNHSQRIDFLKLKKLLKEINVNFIESQRLINYDFNNDFNIQNFSMKKKEPVPAVTTIFANLIKIIEDKNSEYAIISQERDSTFPRRLILNLGFDPAENIDDKSIYKKIQEIEDKNRALMELGILESRESNDLPQEKMTSETRRVLTLYVEDTKIKLSVFDDLEKKMSLFQEIINTQFSNKELKVKKGKGFVFKLKTGEFLTPEKLSSGEQHEIVIIVTPLYNATFIYLI